MFVLGSASLIALATAGSLSHPFDPTWMQREVGSSSNYELASLVLLSDAAKQSGAKCLDGTPGAYYIRPGSGDGAKKWYIHHEGGGWCTDFDDCVSRAKIDLGSSKAYQSTMDLGGGYLSQDPDANPMMYNWNSVYLKYCDGGSFSGNNASTTTFEGMELHFRGKAILDAIQQDLLAKGMKDATDVVISGCSAGGLAAFLHVDKWASLLQPSGARVVGMPDSGFFLDYQAYDGDLHEYDCGGHYHAAMKWVFEYMDCAANVNQNCIAAHDGTGDAWKCMFAEHTAPHIVTPTFALQGAYDSWQLDCDLKSNPRDTTAVNAWGRNLTTLVEQNLLGTNKKHGVFLDSCEHHCGGWGQYYVNGKSQAQAFQEWYEKGSKDLPNKGYYTQAQEYPCTDCCTPPQQWEEEMLV